MININISALPFDYNLAKPMKKSMQTSLNIIQGRSKVNSPRKEGDLKKSITNKTSTDGLSGVVYTNKVYANIREYVNNKNPNRKFYMKRAMEGAKSQVQATYDRNIGKELDKHSRRNNINN